MLRDALQTVGNFFSDLNIAQITGAVIAFGLMLTGLIGTFLPFLPGTPLIFVGALIYGLATRFAEISGTVLLALGIIATVSTLLQYLASYFGAKKLGSTGWGTFGAFLGTILGIFIPTPLGLFNLVVFPFVFAFAFELIATSSVKKSFKAGFGGVIGVFGSIFVQLALGLAMIAIFVIALF